MCMPVSAVRAALQIDRSTSGAPSTFTGYRTPSAIAEPDSEGMARIRKDARDAVKPFPRNPRLEFAEIAHFI